ncbi:hypothetical protein GCM10009535_28610 [Streptomyces thermocarboxydovorans]|uniref:Uncharacterized protein n=1 Tax=Streptomyces thermocarboxydovorans TaxID=59298 RepID=A0ABP3SS58_9ACTN
MTARTGLYEILPCMVDDGDYLAPEKPGEAREALRRLTAPHRGGTGVPWPPPALCLPSVGEI